MLRDNYYETSISAFKESIRAMGSNAETKNPQLTHLMYGLLRMAEGLLQESRIVEQRLKQIEDRLLHVK